MLFLLLEISCSFILQVLLYMYCSRAGLLLVHEGVYQPIGIV